MYQYMFRPRKESFYSGQAKPFGFAPQFMNRHPEDLPLVPAFCNTFLYCTFVFSEFCFFLFLLEAFSKKHETIIKIARNGSLG